jgi:hypothetical protein
MSNFHFRAEGQELLEINEGLPGDAYSDVSLSPRCSYCKLIDPNTSRNAETENRARKRFTRKISGTEIQEIRVLNPCMPVASRYFFASVSRVKYIKSDVTWCFWVVECDSSMSSW